MEDRVWIEKFIKDFFLTESTIYTLFGSKPMSEIPLCCAAKGDWLSGYSKLIQNYPEEKKQKALSELESYIDDYDLPINWNRWVNWSSKNLDRSFLFSKRTTDSKDLFSIYVVNVQETAWILQKHYSLISRELDMEFEPLQAVLEFEDLDSLFWQKVFNSHFVQGILHGYGKRNSYFFDRKILLQEKNTFDLYTHPIFKSALDIKDKKKDLPLPRFRSFSSDLSQDPAHQKYQREKQQIRKTLKEKNKFDLVLKQLGYRANFQSEEIAFN
ncbi:MAG: hypothetical protein K940chlam2_00400 [Chlamydiae bacterium]|nr:hypothetical protein [Chlamydiota bacterium]